MKILYISALASNSCIQEIYEETKQNPGFAVQKFSRLIVKGLQKNGADVTALSIPPFSSKKRIKLKKSEIEDGLRFLYVPSISFPIIKHLVVLLFVFIYVLIWGLFHRKDKAIICDILSISGCMGALFASKINHVESIAVVTDILGQIVGTGHQNNLSKIASKLSSWYSKRFDKYVLLTEQMNYLVNPSNRPYIVMEALCDSDAIQLHDNLYTKSIPRIVLYAGGIFEQYGLKMLAEGFLNANIPDSKLVYYGDGPYVDEYKKLCLSNSNLEYKGVATNDVIINEEYKATLLVNPRFSSEEFAKYSFPSKNMEYMASGTPLLTTKLPGMPKEYYPYVFLFEEETVEGYSKAIRYALSYPIEKLYDFGFRAKQFVEEQKNNIVQTKRILELISN